MNRLAIPLLVLPLACGAVSRAVEPLQPQPSAAAVPKKADPAEAHALAKVLRELLVKNIPAPLSKSSSKWGRQTAVTVMNRRREGLRIWSEPVQEMRNDGVWRRYEMRIPEPSKIVLAVTDLTRPGDGRAIITIGVQVERLDMKFEQQVWRKGLRLYSGETRAHCKGSLLLKAEINSKTELKPGSFLPDVKLQVRATEAQVGYDDVVVDHTAGLDGDAANAVGDFAIRMVKSFKPDLEGDLLKKANAAIVKAAGNRELKVALDSLLKKK
ncbi:MAG TPA: hypothetical protein VLM40_19285 [Gemmata sp.]|nr:hypothetical protein [Gemmata sp.]